MTMKLATVVGARPQFIKAAGLSRTIKQHYCNKVQEDIIHTGQHFDDNMSQVFFDELDIPKPRINLDIAGSSHGKMTGRMLESLEAQFISSQPDWVLVYGDTDTTLAAALAASKMHIPIAHVEAGLRSYNKRMPEEINRVLSDHVSSLLFCPTDNAVMNLAKEGVKEGVSNVGDIMYEVSNYYQEKAGAHSSVLEQHQLNAQEYILVTCHRAENTDNETYLNTIFDAIIKVADETKVVLPLHPRTEKALAKIKRNIQHKNLVLLPPVAYLDMICLSKNAKVIMTDSGGLQKEAFFYQVPCVTIRDETEWVETLNDDWNQLAPPKDKKIYETLKNAFSFDRDKKQSQAFGDGQTSRYIIERILDY